MKLRPIKLKLAAFEPYVGELELDFEKHLKGKNMFLIHGETGSGKTSILDAICFALYGDSSGGNRTDKMLRSEQAAPSTKTFVEFTFALGSKIYKVYRKINDDSTKNAYLSVINADNTETIIENKQSYVTKKITDLIGFHSDQFRQVVLLPQGKFERFLNSNSGDREKILKILFKADFYEKLEKELKNRAKAKDEELNKYETQFKTVLSGLTSIDELNALIESNTQELTAVEKQQSILTSNCNEANSRLNDARHLNNKFSELESKQVEYKDTQSKYDSTQTRFSAASIEFKTQHT